MKKKLFTLLVLLCMAVSGAWADKLTVHDGTTTISYVPFYGLWMDDYTRGEMIYPASELADMTGATINSLTFYKNSNNTNSWGSASYQIYLKEVSSTTLSAYIGITDATTVYEGSIDATGGEREITITFTTNYTYNGGNLLIGVYQTVKGSYSSAYWFGETVTGASASGYNSNSPADASFNQRNFLPKTTFTYEKSISTYSLTKAEGAEAHGAITFKVGDNTNATTAAEGQKVTVTITPDEGWAGEPVGQWIAAVAAARNRTSGTSDIGLLSNFELTPVENQENTWTFKMQRANAEISATYKKLLTHTDITISDIAPMTYTGKALKPTVVVKDGTTTLDEGTDYTVSYSNNVNAGTNTATANVTGKGKYAGTVKKKFTINQAEGSVRFTPWKLTKKYGDPNFTHTPVITGSGTVTYGSDDANVASVDANTGEVTIKAVGKAWIAATLVGANYTDARDTYLVIVEPKDIDYEGGTVTQDENGYTVTLTEDEDNPNADPLPDDVDLAGLTYSRTLTAPGSSEGDVTIDDQPANLYTICLPFAPETGDAAKYYTLSSVSGETLNFDEVAAPVANTPYLVAVMGNVNFIESCTDQDVASMTINSSTVDGYTFNGTFTGMTNAEAQGKYILQAGNKWGKVTAENTGAFIPPFRAFIEGPASGARLLAGSIGGDGNTTGIKYIHTQDSNGSEQWYDLNGRRIERPTQNGIYIHNGRKEVLK